MDKEAQEAVVQALDDDNAIICAAAALLLRHAGVLLNETRTAAGEKIMEILKDEERSHRPLDPPNYSRIWRLDDMLFETLQAIAERLMDQETGVGKREPLSRGASRHEHRRHRGSHADADRRDVRFDVLHGVVDRHTGGDDAAS